MAKTSRDVRKRVADYSFRWSSSAYMHPSCKCASVDSQPGLIVSRNRLRAISNQSNVVSVLNDQRSLWLESLEPS